MKKIHVFLIVFLVFSAHGFGQTNIPTPEEHFGFVPGTDRMLFNYDPLIEYLKILETGSDKIKLQQIGASPQGREIFIAFISDAENIANLDRLQHINKELALNSALSDEEKDQYIREGKAFFLMTMSMHSTEVGPTQSVPLIAHEWITTDDKDVLQQLKDVVVMIVPSHNPDGMELVINNYKKYKGTKYEGASLPGVYHKYVGHDNNRDFVILSQKDTKAISDIFSQDWFPQVMVEKHQMGSRTARYFVPPMHDPIAENVDAGIWNWSWIIGSNLITDMTADGLSGVSQHYLFDDYWPGSTETCIWKGVIGYLTEAASVQGASPIYVEANELRGYGKGLGEYKKSINMPLPWPGGWWRLSDIVDYELSSMRSALKTMSNYRDDILRFRNDLTMREVERGRTDPPYYYILPVIQRDQSELAALVNLLKEHGVKVYQLTAGAGVGLTGFSAGDIVVPLAQPFRAFIKEVMEKQNFPVRHYTPGGKMIKPYDITSWSLPMHRGVDSYEINTLSKDIESNLAEISEFYSIQKEIPASSKTLVFPAGNNESFKAAFMAHEAGLTVNRLDKASGEYEAGSFILPVSSGKNKIDILLRELTVSPYFSDDDFSGKAVKVNFPRIALVETYFHDMDAGWTRFIFDQYHIPFKVLHPGDFEKANLDNNFDVIVFPDADKSILMDGKYKSNNQYYISSYPPEFTKGIGKNGMQNILKFMDNGGIILSWGRSVNLFLGSQEIEWSKNKKEAFQLPVRNIAADLKKDGLYIPGSLLKVQLKGDHPLTWGLPAGIGVFSRGRPVFTTSVPHFDMDRRVIGTYPEKDILMSGYGEKIEKLSNRTVMAWIKKNKGQLVLYGFNPQFRASTQGAFKLLFNGLLLK